MKRTVWVAILGMVLVLLGLFGLTALADNPDAYDAVIMVDNPTVVMEGLAQLSAIWAEDGLGMRPIVVYNSTISVTETQDFWGDYGPLS